MIIGEYEVPYIGTLEIMKDCTPFNPRGEDAFKLTSASSDLGRFAFHPSREDGGLSLQLVGFGVASDMRGKGLGSFMMGKAVEFAKASGAFEMTAWAFNERTVRCFDRYFSEQELTVRMAQENSIGVGSEMVVADAISYLEKQRRQQFSPEEDPDGTRMLKGPAVYLQGSLA
jgi:GNAT superfamily N-acetyltransferase